MRMPVSTMLVMGAAICCCCLVVTPLAAASDRAGHGGDDAAQPPGGVIGGGVGTLPDRPQPRPQPQGVPPRDRRPVPPQTGTASIRGRVVDGVTGQPIARAQVRITGRGNVVVTTDASGTFVFTNLPAGRFTLYVSKTTYLNATFPESTHSLRAPRAIDVEDGQAIANVNVTMFHGGVMTGLIVDAHGDPVENVMMTARRVARSGRLSRGNGGGGGTNDAGEFRIGRLDSGSYILMATPHGPSIEGETMVPTFYPGTLNADQAQPVVIERGQTLSGLDFALIEQPVSSVKGSVIDDQGKPATGGHISVSNSALGAGNNYIAGTRIEEDGSFALQLPPGNYLLSAYIPPAPNPAAAAGGNGTNGPNATARSDDGRSEGRSGTLRVSVGGEPNANVVIIAGDGGTISGRIVFDGDGPPPQPAQIDVAVQSVPSLSATMSDVIASGVCRARGRGLVNADLTFTIEGVQGSCILTANTHGSQWHVRSAKYQSIDLLDRPIELRSNQHVRGVELTLSNRQTTLTADVTDENGTTSLDYVLLAFSTDRTRWTSPRYSAFAVRQPPRSPQTQSQPQSQPQPSPTLVGRSYAQLLPLVPGSAAGLPPSAARNTLMWLPPGDYYVVALEDATIEDVHDPAFFEELVPSATQVTLRDSEAQTVSLHRIKPPASPAQ